MKAMRYNAYGTPDVIEMKELDIPSINDDEVLIKIRATTVTAGDCEIRRFQIPFFFWLPLRIILGVKKPKMTLGTELSGEIESVGKNVTRFKKGDAIFAFTGFKFGAFAQYVALPEHATIAQKPKKMSFEEAAAVHIGGFNALHFLRACKVQPGQSILVYGASGSIGTAAVQLAKYYGAEVTGICSEHNFDMIKTLGATHAIDYNKEDFTKNNKTYDIIFDAIGKSSFFDSLKVLKKDGIYAQANPSTLQMMFARPYGFIIGKKIITSFAGESVEDLDFLSKLNDNGQFTTAVDRTYPLEQLAEAHRYVEKGHKKGNVVITVAHDES